MAGIRGVACDTLHLHLSNRSSSLDLTDQNACVTFTQGNRTITTQLVFNAEDRLVDFISDDRYCRMPGDKLARHRFTTPARDHRVIDGMRVPGYGDGFWYLPEGPYAYGRFHLRTCAYDR